MKRKGNKIECDDKYAYIYLNSKKYPGLISVIDKEYLYFIKEYTWYPLKGDAGVFYARTSTITYYGKRKTLHLHNLILPIRKGYIIDHINHNGLDNRRENLRIVSNSQNLMNQRIQKRKMTSPHKGVSLITNRTSFQSVIKLNGKNIYLGSFKNEIDAAKAYDEAAIKYFGEFACLNFPK